MREVLQARWIHSKYVEAWLRKMAIGHTLNVCCGMSRVGDIRLDIDPKSNRTQAGDLFKLPFEPLSFDTIICDPPFSYFNRFKWILNLADLARKRFLISSPNISVSLARKRWKRNLYYESNSSKIFLRTYWCFDRRNYRLDESNIVNNLRPLEKTSKNQA